MAFETALTPSAMLGWAYHLSYFFGSVSVGYLLLRLTYPDIRIIDKNKSLGISFVLGAAVYVFAQASSESIAWVSGISGLLPGIILAYSTIGFLLLKIYFYFNTPSLLTVGVPMHSAAIAAKAFDEPQTPSIKQSPMRDEVTPSWIKSSRTAPSATGSKVYISENAVSSQKEAGIGSSYFGQRTSHVPVPPEGTIKSPAAPQRKIEPAAEKLEAQEEEEDINELMYGKAAKKGEQEPKKEPMQKEETVQKIQQQPANAKRPEIKPAPEAPAISPQPALGKPAKPGFFDGLFASLGFGNKQKPSTARPGLMLPAVVQNENSISHLPPSKPATAEKQGKPGFKATPLPKITAPQNAEQAPPWILRNQKLEKGTQEPAATSADNENATPTITLDVIPRKKEGQNSRGGKIAPELLAPKENAAQQPSQQGVREVAAGEQQIIGEAKRYAQDNEKASLIELEVPIKHSDDGARPRLFTAVGEPAEARKTIRRAKEAEAEIMLDDIMPQIEKQNRGIRNTDYDGGDSQNASADGQQTALPRHRMYAQDQDSIRVVAPKEVMESGEFGEIINDVYGQLKNTSGKPSGQFVNTPPKSSMAMASDKNVKVLSDPDGSGATTQFSDLEKELFGKETAAPKQAGATSEGQGLFDQLNTINSTGGVPPGAKQPIKATSDVEFVHIQGAKGLGCPNCHQNNSRIVFCPYCGSGMCANCSPSVRMEPDGFAYICPKCGEEVHIKKKAAH